MAQSIAFYLLMHQPWRFRLPLADPLLADAPMNQWQAALFDGPLNRRYFSGVAERSYIPMLTLLEELLDQGFCVNLGVSWTFWEQAELFGEPLTSLLSRVLAHPGVEIVGVEPYHSLIPFIDAAMFRRRMKWMQGRLEKRFKKRVQVTDTTEMFYSDLIYWSLADAGFSAMLIDGRPSVAGAEGPAGLYRGPASLKLIPRHWRLSDDVGYRFSNRDWDGYPLLAPTYAEWLKNAPGPFITVGWDFETFGEHHRAETGIFAFMRQLPVELKRRGITSVRFSEVLDVVPTASLTPPLEAETWAGTGTVDFFVGNRPQWHMFLNMASVYHKAKLTGQPGAVDLALRLMQSDHLHMLHWYELSGPEADVSMYFTPGEWWDQGRDGMLAGLEAIFAAFDRALDNLLYSKRARESRTSPTTLR
ncbi:glycoside hydrolase [Sulfobacillus harzensis]|uniref:Glycoside hydrolase n=1 Tax=Sulfobacillus harzensis TaxID=2729629 RepID=A0A7Y0Q5C1_9FIRM|nr:glycoside hydrolase [Sulfobacillus harzensis]NMP24139.1 glycoside hydrolase [Sulfobacillus harzensis]